MAYLFHICIRLLYHFVARKVNQQNAFKCVSLAPNLQNIISHQNSTQCSVERGIYIIQLLFMFTYCDISGTNKFASQKGMSMGAVRHVADIKADDMDQEAQGHIGLQAGTNAFASQKGMSFGKGRGVSDIRISKVTDDQDMMF